MRSKLSNLLCPPCPFCVLPGRPEQETAGGWGGGQGKEKIPEKKRKGERKVEGRSEVERRETKEEAVYLNLFLEGRMKTFLRSQDQTGKM